MMANDNIKFKWEKENSYDPKDIEEPNAMDIEYCTNSNFLELGIFNQKGEKGMKRDHQMKLAEITTIQAGWLEKCQDGPPDLGDINPVVPNINHLAGQWKAALQAKH